MPHVSFRITPCLRGGEISVQHLFPYRKITNNYSTKQICKQKQSNIIGTRNDR